MRVLLKNTEQHQVTRLVKEFGEEHVASIYIDNKKSLADLVLEAPIIGVTYKDLPDEVVIRTMVRVMDKTVTIKGYIESEFNEQ